MKHPQQPIYVDKHGVHRFKPNKIINYLFATGKLDLNEIGLMPWFKEDQQQIAQLLGYSIGGYNDLSYTDEIKDYEVTDGI